MGICLTLLVVLNIDAQSYVKKPGGLEYLGDKVTIDGVAREEGHGFYMVYIKSYNARLGHVMLEKLNPRSDVFPHIDFGQTPEEEEQEQKELFYQGVDRSRDLAARPSAAPSETSDKISKEKRVEVKLQNIIGGSAEVALYLEMYDRLHPEESLSKGHKIVATGFINEMEYILPVGGIKYKVWSAEEAGMDYFLSSRINYYEAKEHVGDEMTLVKVTTLEELHDFFDNLPEKKINTANQ